LALLAACSSGRDQASTGFSTDYYISHAAGNYRPPGSPDDPWGPYIKIASERFDVPQQWIRHVMRAESGGQEYMNGQLTVSPAGAMGLMQLEPETYQEMAARYGLGTDPFNPYDNIMAGTAYIHEMYAVYGSPGFLAAYNAGPGRLDSYMNYHTPLPHETTNYVAMIAPQIQGVYPTHRSEADELALNTQPASEAPGLLPAGVSPGEIPPPDVPINPIAPVQFAAIVPQSAPDSAIYSPPPARAQPVPPSEHHSEFALIPSAMADTPVPHSMAAEPSGAGWAIQVGAYNSRENAKAALGIAELSAVKMLMHGQPVVVAVQGGYSIKYRARVVGLPHDDAVAACQRLSEGPTGCVIISPDAQL
jgi:cell division protein FtsN